MSSMSQSYSENGKEQIKTVTQEKKMCFFKLHLNLVVSWRSSRNDVLMVSHNFKSFNLLTLLIQRELALPTNSVHNKKDMSY